MSPKTPHLLIQAVETDTIPKMDSIRQVVMGFKRILSPQGIASVKFTVQKITRARFALYSSIGVSRRFTHLTLAFLDFIHAANQVFHVVFEKTIRFSG